MPDSTDRRANAGPGKLGRLWRMPVLLLVGACLFWAGNFIIGRGIGQSAPPFFLSFWRWLLALLLLLPFAWPHLRRDAWVILRHGPLLFGLSLLGIGSFSTLVYIGLRTTPAINGLLLQSVIPMAIILCSFLLFREVPRRGQVLGLVLSAAGVVVIASHGSVEDLLALRLHPGDLWVLAAVLSYAVYSACLRLRPAIHPLSFLAASIGLALVAIGAGALWEARHSPPPPVTGGLLLALAYLALFPSLLAYLFFNRGVELIGANRAGQFIHLLPVFGSLMAVGLLGEALQGFHLAGLALIGAGIVLAMRDR